MKIRVVQRQDAAQISEIYSPYVQNTTITFETESPDAEEFCRRIEKVTRDLPWLVCEEKGKILGYAYASHYHERAAYAWDAECSVYVRQEMCAKGIGSALYRTLLQILRVQGYYTAYALISVPNKPSESMHRKLGFQSQGIWKNTGFKLGRWCNLECLAVVLQSYAKLPKRVPRPFTECFPDGKLPNSIFFTPSC